MLQGLVNLWNEGQEGGYLVQHSRSPASDCPPRLGDENYGTEENFWEKAYPVLFPYGEGGIERDRPVKLSLMQHTRWLFSYHDRRFRTHPTCLFAICNIQQRRQALSSAKIQMARKDFDQDSRLFSSITVDQLRHAADEEQQKLPRSNPVIRRFRSRVNGTASRVIGSDSARFKLRSQIWSTSICFGPASAWMTWNPDPEHNPVAQVFVGNDIDLDHFVAAAGPSITHRLQSIASGGYRSAQYFDFIIRTVLETLFAIRVSRNRVYSKKGVFGKVQAYFGGVESQGRGTLHLHLLMWLKESPSAEEWETCLANEEFREKLRRFIKANCRAYHRGLATDQIIKATPSDPDVAFCRPPDPSSSTYWEEIDELEKRVVRTKQLHTCSENTCLNMNRHGKTLCKRHAPWPLSIDDVVKPSGEWAPKRSIGNINNYNPAIIVSLRCNNNHKVLTNAPETSGLSFYFAGYCVKKQGRSYNLSALLASGMAYHQDHNPYTADLRQSQRLLLFRAANILNKQQELPSPMAGRFLSGRTETVKSHCYPSLHWASFHNALIKQYPDLERSSHLQSVFAF